MSLTHCSLFSGIGGFEVGFLKAGLKTELMCERDPVARAVLSKRFPDVEIKADVCKMQSLPRCDVITAGWPCQDLSQAGRTAGIEGDRSSLVGEVFRLLKRARHKPEFVVLENVAFALHLQSGRALSYVTEELEASGYRWAYRILDSKHFGVPQRRRRLFILGSRTCDPSQLLFDCHKGDADPWPSKDKKYGFYWTEGNTGIGWSPGSIPPLKGGSSLSIPSPPAIWDVATAAFAVPGIRDAEAMQGFSRGWTRVDVGCEASERSRWRLVGNAVSVPVAKWLAKRIAEGSNEAVVPAEYKGRSRNAGSGGPNSPRISYSLAEGPSNIRHVKLSEFGLHSTLPLSKRAASGFLRRVKKSTLRVNPDFIRDLTSYVDTR